MVRSVLIIGGTGLIRRAVARRLLAAGWRVKVTGRDPRRMPADLVAAGVQFELVDRDDPEALAAAVADGCEFLVDCVCYTGAHARLLQPMLSLGSGGRSI